MFGAKSDPIAQEILDEIRAVTKRLAAVEGRYEAVSEARDLTEEINTLKRSLVDTQIEHDRVAEEHAREKRDVEHLVGLQRKRATSDSEAATRDARLAVREEALTEQRKQFEQQMSFREKRFEAEVKYLKSLMEQILTRLPTVEVDKRITVGVVASGKDDD